MDMDRDEKIKEIINAIREQKRKINPIKNKLEHSTKKVVKVVQEKPPRLITLHVGWLHYNETNDRYSQVRQPDGGVRVLTVNSNELLSVLDLRQRVMRLFCEKDCFKFGPIENFEFHIGRVDGSVISRFTNTEGIACGMFEYLKCRGLLPSRFNFYLLSRKQTPIMDVSITEEKQLQVSDIEEYTITYTIQCASLYSDDISALTLTGKAMCYEHATSQNPQLLEDTTLDQFTAIEYGYKICAISNSNKVFYKHDIYLSGSVDVNMHHILHEPDNMVGMYEGHVGTSVIPSCSAKCNLEFTLYKNQRFFCSGSDMYYINMSEDGTYQCKLECKKTQTVMMSNCVILCQSATETNQTNFAISNHQQYSATNTSDESLKIPGTSINREELTICNDQQRSETNKSGELVDIPGILIINRKDLTISNTKLGGGSQGHVKKGGWLGTDVAIKTVNGQ